MTIRTIDTAVGYDRQLKRMFKKHYSKRLYVAAIRALADNDLDVLRQLSDHALKGNCKASGNCTSTKPTGYWCTP